MSPTYGGCSLILNKRLLNHHVAHSLIGGKSSYAVTFLVGLVVRRFKRSEKVTGGVQLVQYHLLDQIRMMTIWVLMDGLMQKIELKTDHDAGADAIRVN